MQVKLTMCLFVLESKKNDNIRKNDIKTIEVLTDKNNVLPTIIYNGKDMKSEAKKEITRLIGAKTFHLEQVFTYGYDNEVEIIYLGIINREYIKKIADGYKLVDFKIENNDMIYFGDKKYAYVTREIIENNNVEYIHEIEAKKKDIKRNLLNILTAYKRVRSNIDNTDILFKFLGSSFTLEDVRIVYEMVKDRNVDKSNFRKKIVKYCEKVDEESSTTGYRPSQKYRFKPLKGDAWLWYLLQITKGN